MVLSIYMLPNHLRLVSIGEKGEREQGACGNPCRGGQLCEAVPSRLSIDVADPFAERADKHVVLLTLLS